VSRKPVSKRARKKWRMSCKKMRAELKMLNETGAPSEWLLRECMRPRRHQLRAKVGLSGMLDGGLSAVHIQPYYTDLLRKEWGLS
jgi:hypothetical protein